MRNKLIHFRLAQPKAIWLPRNRCRAPARSHSVSQ